VVVDVDLERFFDRVNHDILMERLSRRIDDKAVLRAGERVLDGLLRLYDRLHLKVNVAKTAVAPVS